MGMMFLNIRRVDVGSSTYQSMIDYYARDEAINPEQEDGIAIEDVLENPEAIIDYYGRFEDENNGGFDFNGDKSNETALAELNTFKPEQLYQSVISFRPEDAMKLGIASTSDFKRIANSYILSCAKQLNINSSNLVWGGYVHENTDHPHMHIYFFDKSRTEQPLMKKRELSKVRSSLANSILNQVSSYREKDKQYKKVVEDIKMMFTDKNVDTLIGSRLVLGHHKLMSLSDGDKAILSAFKDLSLSIPLEGRKSAESLSKWQPEIYEKVVATRELLLEEVESMAVYKNTVIEITEAMKTLYGNGSNANNYYDNQLNKINKQLDNTIIKYVVENRNELLHPDFDYNDVSLNFMGGFNKLQSSVNKQFLGGLHSFLYSMKPRKQKEREDERNYEEEIDY